MLPFCSLPHTTASGAAARKTAQSSISHARKLGSTATAELVLLLVLESGSCEPAVEAGHTIVAHASLPESPWITIDLNANVFHALPSCQACLSPVLPCCAIPCRPPQRASGKPWHERRKRRARSSACRKPAQHRVRSLQLDGRVVVLATKRSAAETAQLRSKPLTAIGIARHARQCSRRPNAVTAAGAPQAAMRWLGPSR